MMQLLDTGRNTAASNMLLDEKLLNELDPNGIPILHLYQWAAPSATFGLFIKPENHLNLEKAQKWGLDLGKRPTGGGIVFHVWDLAFSFLMPANHKAFSLNTLQNYEFVNKAVLEVVRSFFGLKPELIPQNGPELSPACKNFCMAKPTIYDVVHQGVKIAGAAQRRTKEGYLHQGTISLTSPNLELLEDVLLSKDDVVKAMEAFTFAPVKFDELDQVRREIEKLLADKLKESLNFVAYV
jgi:lipoate-protein ligase A